MDAFLFRQTDYKHYLEHMIHRHASLLGYKRRLAEAAGCKPSYLSQVLHGKVQLTGDHAHGLTQFWRLSDLEADFFLKLVDYARAARPPLRERIKRDLLALQFRAEKLENRMEEIGMEKVSDPSAIYYSAWYYSFCHVLLTSRETVSLKYLRQKSRLPEPVLLSVMEQLGKIGFAEKSGKQEWKARKHHVHLSDSVLYTQLYHHHWRTMAHANFPQRGARDLHYTVVQTVPADKLAEARDILAKALQAVREFAKIDGDGEVVCVTMDFFEPKGAL